MTQVVIRNLPVKKFEGRYVAEYGHGVAGLTNKVNGKWNVRINQNLNKKDYQRIVNHEMGHAFVGQRKITSKIPIQEKRALVNRYGGVAQDGATNRAQLQEVLAEMYRVERQPNKFQRVAKEMRKIAPQTYCVINQERKKFRPKILFDWKK